ncbi:MAG: GMC family oxidoreductase N-terminal domain-containing protein [Actinobacteria bacterium]|nr:GMC family oxidoreductase N-terminal domain-containing protein [Actinomycetota bacterium]
MIVIGCGGGGPVVAKELAARGLDVLVLEAGPRHADPEDEWTHFENDANNILTGFFRWGPTDRSKPAWFRETPQNSVVWQLSGVGGTTQHYYGNSPRAMPGAFVGYSGADAAAYDTAHPFPFTYEELVPYYEWVEATLPVQTAAMGTKEELFLTGAEAMGLPYNASKNVTRDSFRPQENAILQPGGNAGLSTDAGALEYPEATGCTFCGYCFQGCYQPIKAPRNLKAKRSTDNSYVPMMLTADCWAPEGQAAELITDAFVTQIATVDEGGATVARAVTWRVGATGETQTEEATVIVMAGGCTENPRLWLNSELPNPNDWVGRGYTDHYFDWVIGEFDTYTGSSKGVGSSARADFPGLGGLENVGLPPALQGFSNGFSDGGFAGYYTNGYTPPSDADTFGRLAGVPFAELTSRIDQLLNVLVITDDDVEAQNRVTLSSSYGPDEHGPVPKVTFRHRERSQRTRQNRATLTQKAVDLLRAAGAERVHHINWPPLILHVQSTMRMGLDEADSVLTPDGEARFVKRLFIADNSALANGIGGPNPTMTMQAVATRTAERIFRMYFDGDAWVGNEAPVASIDDHVTQAVLEGRCDDLEPSSPSPPPVDRAPAPLPTTGSGSLPLLAGAAALAAREVIRLRTRNERD